MITRNNKNDGRNNSRTRSLSLPNKGEKRNKSIEKLDMRNNHKVNSSSEFDNINENAKHLNPKVDCQKRHKDKHN